MKKFLVLLAVLLIPGLMLMGCACPTDESAVATPVAPVVVAPTSVQPATPVDSRFTDELIFFAFDSSALSPAAKEILKYKADYMKANPTRTTQIAGYCDERGTAEYNMALGDRRANAAKKYMMDLGVAADRMTTTSYGYEYPLDPAHTPEAWAKNRRAKFNITN